MGAKSLTLSLALCGLLSLPAFEIPALWAGQEDPLLLNTGLCRTASSGPPPVLRQLLLAQARTETRPFAPALTPEGSPAADRPPLWQDLGKLSMPITTASPMAQAYFNQGLRLSFAFNHAEARRAFRAAQQADPNCAMCFWGEALVLGPNINAPMFPEAQEPALAAVARAQSLASKAAPPERALIAALARRYSADPKAERAALDTAYADAMAEAAERFPRDDTIQVLYAESLMDLQPWDYWEAGGTKPKGRTAELVPTLERVLKRNPRHPGAIHLYIHAVEASNAPKRALPYARELAKLMPGAGHIVHMPSHIYYRVGLYKDSLDTNRAAVAADERYFGASPSEPFYRNAYYPHNLHFLMVSAQMGGDGKTALEAAQKLDKAIDTDFVRKAGVLQPIKAAPYFTHAQFSDPQTILALPDPGSEFLLVKAMWHYARALAHAANKDTAAAEQEIGALGEIQFKGDFKALTDWQVPGQDIVATARLVAQGRLATAQGDLERAANAYREAVAIQDKLAYMEPPYWYYPVRQSLGAVLLRSGNPVEAEAAFRESLVQTPNNGWALYGLQQVYKQKGDDKSAQAAGQALEQAWFGDRSRLDLARL
jgi:tetratricopeptide (TPR) repeat protein